MTCSPPAVRAGLHVIITACLIRRRRFALLKTDVERCFTASWAAKAVFIRMA